MVRGEGLTGYSHSIAAFKALTIRAVNLAPQPRGGASAAGVCLLKTRVWGSSAETVGYIGGSGWVSSTLRWGSTPVYDGTAVGSLDQRYYATGAGRFMTADPYRASAGASEPGSWNRYSYVESDPTNAIDPNGLMSIYAALLSQYVARYTVTVTASVPGGGGGGGGGSEMPNWIWHESNDVLWPTWTPAILPKCPELPPDRPGVANVLANMDRAAEVANQALDQIAASISGPDGGTSAFGSMARVVVWWTNMVRPGGTWDYKTQGIQFESFGNFNFGSAGLAAGFTEDQLLRAAGVVQVITDVFRAATYALDMVGRAESGEAPTPAPGRIGSGWPFGPSPHGDDVRDQTQIRAGFAYYRAVIAGCLP